MCVCVWGGGGIIALHNRRKQLENVYIAMGSSESVCVSSDSSHRCLLGVLFH